MIRYALVCQQAHDFESWFPSSEAFEDQRSRNLVTCPVCGSALIEKQIMAPSVLDKKAPYSEQTAHTTTAQKLTVLDEKEQNLRHFLHSLHEHVQKHSEHVGERFPEEARKMHYGESEQRSIHGQANAEEARSLLEEGIEFFPLPSLPEKQN